jgi:enoyl-CoA hydratase/carnithine racemase
MSDYETILYEVRDDVGLLTLNRPERINAINEAMIVELEEFWAARKNDSDVRVIVLAGAGEKGFCAGIDLKDTMSTLVEADLGIMYKLQARISRLILAMRQAPQPIIGTIHGAAVGGGLSFAVGCCIRIISPDARFGAAYINVGLGGADCGSSYFLPRLIGAGRAYEYMLTGDFMDAETALSLGMVSRIVPRDKLLDEALELAAKMCRKNPLGLKLTKEAINCNLDAAGLEQALNLEDRNQALCMATMRYEGQLPDTR